MAFVPITNSEIENELQTRKYLAVSPGNQVPPQQNPTNPSTPEGQLVKGVSNEILMLIAFGVVVVLFE